MNPLHALDANNTKGCNLSVLLEIKRHQKSFRNQTSHPALTGARREPGQRLQPFPDPNECIHFLLPTFLIENENAIVLLGAR